MTVQNNSTLQSVVLKAQRHTWDVVKVHASPPSGRCYHEASLSPRRPTEKRVDLKQLSVTAASHTANVLRVFPAEVFGLENGSVEHCVGAWLMLQSPVKSAWEAKPRAQNLSPNVREK